MSDERIRFLEHRLAAGDELARRELEVELERRGDRRELLARLASAIRPKGVLVEWIALAGYLPSEDGEPTFIQLFALDHMVVIWQAPMIVVPGWPNYMGERLRFQLHLAPGRYIWRSHRTWIGLEDAAHVVVWTDPGAGCYVREPAGPWVTRAVPPATARFRCGRMFMVT